MIVELDKSSNPLAPYIEVCFCNEAHLFDQNWIYVCIWQ